MEPVRPDHDQGVTNVAAALLGERDDTWLPQPAREATTTVMLVVDGLGWTALERHADRAPVLRAMGGGPIPTVVPSTTVVALTSITTGLPPAEHGLVGYRMKLPDGVFNLLRWKLSGRSSGAPDPDALQPHLPFRGRPVPVVTRAEYRDTGFTTAHLRGTRMLGCHAVSDLVGHVRSFVEAGEPFVYAYYGWLDLVAHMQGLRDDYFPAEIAFVDRLVGELLDVLPPEAALVVTADHGHVHVDRWVEPSGLASMVDTWSGEGRFRSLHAKPGAADDLEAAAREVAGDSAWVFTRRELFDDGWFGPRAPSMEVAARVGDVVIASRDGTFFDDPTNPGEHKLISGHGSLTPDEMLVPLLAAHGRG